MRKCRFCGSTRLEKPSYVTLGAWLCRDCHKSQMVIPERDPLAHLVGELVDLWGDGDSPHITDHTKGGD